MALSIADTFTDSLARLTRDEQKAVKTTAFDLQMNPALPGNSFHKLDRARDPNFWSVRVSADIRLIVHKTGASLLLCYVDHHDKAYAWAERRKLETHPATGAAQLVEIRERVVEIPVPRYVDVESPTPKAIERQRSGALPLFAQTTREEMLAIGVPDEWTGDALAATEDSILELADHLPREAAEALLDWATGKAPVVAPVVPVAGGPFAHPDAQRRFRVIQNSEELERALDYPWEKWTVFLHPAQRVLVERRYSGPARVAGSAGTGKTVVALHRAAHQARANPGAKVLLTTFSITLGRMLRQKLERLTGPDRGPSTAPPAGTSFGMTNGSVITIDAIDEVVIGLFTAWLGKPLIATPAMMQSLLSSIAREIGGHGFSDRFIVAEWEDVVDPWQIDTWDAYRDVQRLGRKTRLGEKQRAALWQIFDRAKARLEEGAMFTRPTVYGLVTEQLRHGRTPPFDFAVVDEAQDVSVPQLRFLAALGANRPEALFFAGDLGQRIFQTPFSWKSLGVDVRGRSNTLRINYRTSHQIRRQADRLLGPEVGDVDGLVESRKDTISMFNGPEPDVRVVRSIDDEETQVGQWLQQRVAEGIRAEDIGVFVRSEAEVPRAREAIKRGGLGSTSPAPGVDPEAGKVGLMPMHLAKGLEFRAVVVMACDDEVLPLQSRIEAVTDESDLEEVYNTERQLLYVACTRARDHLLVTAVAPGSEFLGDLTGHSAEATK
jgi:mRNA-degrading endonuclease RelE of RelBE toxin-antitoxin system